MVRMYGIAIINSFGMALKPHVCITIEKASAKPKISPPMAAPIGFQFPRKHIAKAIHPLPQLYPQ